MRSPSGSQGFTLLELLVVLVILIVLAGLSIPHIRLPQTLEGAARQMSGLIQALHNTSRAKKLMYRLHFNVPTGEYWVTAIQGAIEGPVQDPQFRGPRSLPQDVQFQEVLVGRRGHTKENTIFMQFFPVGRIEPTVIYLRNQEDVLSLLVHPVTGSVRIVKGHYVPRQWKDLSA